MSTKHNGWSNYATWRVYLEILSDIEFDQFVDAEYLEEITNDIVFNNTVEKDCLAADYARAFLADVDYNEIAEAINADLQITN